MPDDIIDLVRAITADDLSARARRCADDLQTARADLQTTRNALQAAIRSGEASAAEVARLTALYNAAEAAHQAAVARARTLQATVDALTARATAAEADLAQTDVELAALLARHTQAVADLAAARAERDRVTAAAQAAASADLTEDAAFQASIAALNAEVAALRARVAELTPPVLPWEAVAPLPRLVIDPTPVPPNATAAHVRLRLVRADGTPYVGIHTTCLAVLSLTNGTGTNVGDGANAARMLPPFAVVWRPGDDAEHVVTLNLLPMTGRGTAGNFVTLSAATKGMAVEGSVSGRIAVTAGAINALPAQMPRHRLPRRLDLAALGAPQASMNIDAMQWSASGFVGNAASGTPCWRSQLAHGRSQPGNGEVGLYVDETFPGIAPPFVKETDGAGRRRLRIRSQRLATPIVHEGGSWNYGAAMLQGQRLREWCIRTGLFRAQMVTPSRRGAWAAFWTAGIGLSTLATAWPYEIDIMENFNGSWGASFANDETSGGQHLGRYGSNSRAKVNLLAVRLRQLGFAACNMWAEVHDWACHIEEERITVYVDGVETYSAPNMCVHEDPARRSQVGHYPMLNVAVRLPSATYDEAGTTSDLLVYGAQVYASVPAAALGEMTEARPWANRGVTVTP